MGVPINFEEVHVSGTDSLDEAMNSITRNQVCLKGNIVTDWPNNKSRNLLLRHDLDLYANVVHAKSFSSIETRLATLTLSSFARTPRASTLLCPTRPFPALSRRSKS